MFCEQCGREPLTEDAARFCAPRVVAHRVPDATAAPRRPHRPGRHRPRPRQPPMVAPPPPPPPSSGWATPSGAHGYATPTRTNGLAIASMVLGILWLYWIGSILALVFGYVAKSQIKRSNGAQTGRGMAIAGIVLGWVGVGLLALVIVIAIIDASS